MAISLKPKENDQIGFCSLPDQVVSQILLQLPPKDFATCQKVCSLLRNNVLQDERFYLQKNCPKSLEHLGLTLEGLWRTNDGSDKTIKKHESVYLLPEGVMISDSEDSEPEGTILNFTRVNIDVTTNELVSPSLRKLSQNTTIQMNQYCKNGYTQLKEELSLLVALCNEHTQKNEFLIDEPILIEKFAHLETILSFCSLFYEKLNETKSAPHLSDLIHKDPNTRIGIYIKLLLLKEMGINIHNEAQFKNCCNDQNQIPYLSPSDKKHALQMWDKDTNQIFLSETNPLASIEDIKNQLMKVDEDINFINIFNDYPENLKAAILEQSEILQRALEQIPEGTLNKDELTIVAQELRRIFNSPSENLTTQLTAITGLRFSHPIPDNLLKNFPNLRKIRASNTKVITSATFSGCHNLEKIILKNSDIKKIVPRAFFDCKNLRILNLQGNDLLFFDPEILYGCASLEKLDISKNGFSALPPFSFIHVPNLKLLLISSLLFSSENPLCFHQGALFGLINCEIQKIHIFPDKHVSWFTCDGLNEKYITNTLIENAVLDSNSTNKTETLNEHLIAIINNYGLDAENIINRICFKINPVFMSELAKGSMTESATSEQIKKILCSDLEVTFNHIYDLEFFLKEKLENNISFLYSMFGMDPIYRICEELSPDFTRDCSQDEIDAILYADLDNLKEATIMVIREIVEFLAQKTTFQEGLEEY